MLYLENIRIFSDCDRVSPSKVAMDEALQSALWTKSEEIMDTVKLEDSKAVDVTEVFVNQLLADT